MSPFRLSEESSRSDSLRSSRRPHSRYRTRSRVCWAGFRASTSTGCICRHCTISSIDRRRYPLLRIPCRCGCHSSRGIEFRNVSFTYPGRSEPALDDVSFTIDLGETIALVGKNGAGKSTIVKLLGRLYDPESGQILIDGVDVREYDPNELRSQFGMMFQDYAMYQLPVAENIGVGNVQHLLDRDAIESAATRGGASQLIESLPDQYDTILGKWFEDGHQLSGGEWQRIALSRAFMRDAQILILDEPTSALDAEAEYDLFARIKRLAEGRMAIFISHRFSTTRRADRILVLENAKLIEQGTHAELMQLGGRYAELFNLQAESYLEPDPGRGVRPRSGTRLDAYFSLVRQSTRSRSSIGLVRVTRTSGVPCHAAKPASVSASSVTNRSSGMNSGSRCKRLDLEDAAGSVSFRIEPPTNWPRCKDRQCEIAIDALLGRGVALDQIVEPEELGRA